MGVNVALKPYTYSSTAFPDVQAAISLGAKVDFQPCPSCTEISLMVLFVDDEIFILFPCNLLFHFDSITEEEYCITVPQFVDVVFCPHLLLRACASRSCSFYTQ